MSNEPLIDRIEADRVAAIGRDNRGTVNLGQVTYNTVTLPSGRQLTRVFAAVPPSGPSLVGRERVLEETRELVTRGGPHTVSALRGLPGVGKTALALALAHDERTLEHFTGGVLWAGLGPQADVAGALGRWATYLGADISSAATVDERVHLLNARVQHALGGKRLLLILDDAWTWEAAAAFRQFTAPGAALLLTTRHQDLAADFAGTRVLTVPELGEGEAFLLLAEVAPDAARVFPEGVRDLAQTAGGLPLALALLGAELRRQGEQPRWIRQEVERLRSEIARLELADRQERPGVPKASITLRAAIELSLAALPDDAARGAFAALGVFAPKPADFSRDAAVAVWGVEEEVGDGWLRLLGRRGLVEDAGEDRFTLHQVLSAVARVRLGPESMEQTGGLHCDYYVAHANRDRNDWRAIEAELPQIRQAWAWAGTAKGQDERVLALSFAMRVFMARRGLGDEQVRWHARALDAARALGQRVDEAATLNNLGSVHQDRGELAAALEQYGKALAIRREVGDREGEADTLDNIGSIHWRRGEHAAALEHYERALPIRREVGDREGEAITLNNIGTVYLARGDLAAALKHHEQALPVRREVGDRAGEATTLNNIGMVHHARRDLAAALAHFERSLPIRKEVGDRRGEATTLNNIGYVLRARGELAEAVACMEQAVALEEAIGHPDLAQDRQVLQDWRERLAHGSRGTAPWGRPRSGPGGGSRGASREQPAADRHD